MRSDGTSPNFVFFDLSKLDASSAAAFLADRAQRTGSEAFPPGARCHWILAPMRSLDLLAAPGLGPQFLRDRLASGDRLFCTNPTGFDWNHLFPSEAEAEVRTLGALITHEVFLFLENTPRAPGWLAGFDRPVFRASPEGLCILKGPRRVCLPWASPDKRPHRGVWWIVPGQALFAALPPAPWADLPQALPAILDRASSKAPVAKAQTQAPAPAAKLAASGIGELRRSAAPSPLHQSVLFRSQDYPGLGTKEAVDFEEALGGIRKRSLVANMQGQTDLAEAGLKARFLGGRLVRIEDAKSGTVLCTGSESSLDWGGARHKFVVNSAFSFEGDYSWGLRQSLILAHDDLAEPGRAILDFYFVEESREFFVAATVRWPRWRVPTTVTRWAPLELHLFDLPWVDPLSTRTVWPDGRSQDRIHRGEASGVLAGTDFVFAAGRKALVLGFPQNQAPRPHFLPWRLNRGWGRSRLVVAPEGGTGMVPSADFEGIEEHFSFHLTLAEGAKLPFSVTRKQAVELIPPYVMRTEERQE
jgi:hypothetical protein